MKRHWLTRSLVKAALVAAGASFSMAASFAHNTAGFPADALRCISPFPPGPGSDTVAHNHGKAITDETGVSVIVENKPGANGFIAAGQVARANADGYTLFFTSVTTHAANINLFKQLPYSPEKDF